MKITAVISGFCMSSKGKHTPGFHLVLVEWWNNVVVYSTVCM